MLKNINKDIIVYQKKILEIYESIKNQPTRNRELAEEAKDQISATAQEGDDFGINNSDEDDAETEIDQQVSDKESNDMDNRGPDNDPGGSDDETKEDSKIEEADKTRKRLSRLKREESLPNLTDLISKELLEAEIYKNFKGSDIMGLMPLNSVVSPNEEHELNSLEKCHYSLSLEENLELYFTSSPKTTNEPGLNKSLAMQPDEFFNNMLDDYNPDLDKAYQSITDPLERKPYLRQKEENLLNLDKLKSLCTWDREVIGMLVNMSSSKAAPCYFSLPKSIALLNNKSDCLSLTANDVRNFLRTVQKCSSLQKLGVLSAAADQQKQKPEIYKLLDKTDPFIKFLNEDSVKNNICFKQNVLHIIYEHLIDKDFMSRKGSYEVQVSSLFIMNEIKDEKRAYDGKFIYDFYLKYFHKSRYDDKVTHLEGINLMGIRQDAAMRLLSEEMLLVALAIGLIVVVTLLYLKSVVISMIVNLGVAMSVGVSFFAYRIAFDIDLFPFINMMAAFLLIGIACDDVYVLFDAWYSEKAKIIMEDLPAMIEKQNKAGETSSVVNSTESNVRVDAKVDEFLLPPMFVERRLIPRSSANERERETFLHNTNPISIELLDAGISVDQLNKYELNPAYVRLAPLKDEQMIRVMGGTMRHAASSIFVTSFTTAAAFLTNYITKLPYVQLFGVFTGTCILVYFCMVITMVAAFVVSYEKHIQLWRCKIRPTCTKKIEEAFDKVMEKVSLLNYRIVNQHLPNILIRFRFFWFTLFLLLGVGGMIAVFYKPQLRPPTSWKFQFFQSGNLFENFEFQLKDRFWSYVNEEKRNLTNPDIFFVFGIEGKDTGSKFNPDDDGYLLYDKNFDFFDPKSQVWVDKFIRDYIGNRTDLFMSHDIVDEWETYLKQIQLFCHKTLEPIDENNENEIKLPYKRESLMGCTKDVESMLLDSDAENFESLMASFPRRIIFLSGKERLNGILLRVNANRTFSDYEKVSDYYHDLKSFHEDALKGSPKGIETGWFISVGFAIYDLQYQLITGTYSSLVASMAIALITLLLTSGNFIISFFAIITISFSIADTIAIFVFLGWNLSFLESVVIIMSVGLSVDFSCHYGVAYINSDLGRVQPKSEHDEEEQEAPVICGLLKSESKSSCKISKLFRSCLRRYKKNDEERFQRIRDIFSRVGSAVLMASFTTFLAGSSMYSSGLTSFSKMGQFLMLVMCISYIYATFFFVPMCAIFGPTKRFGHIPLRQCFQRMVCCSKKPKEEEEIQDIKKLQLILPDSAKPKTTTSI